MCKKFIFQNDFIFLCCAFSIVKCGSKFVE